jgi:agarase
MATVVTVPAVDAHGATSASPGSRGAGVEVAASGFFRTVKRSGRWWLVTPDGHLFYSSGVDHVSADPDTDRQTGVCPYCQAIAAQYPSTAAWATATVKRLQGWGFNTIGAFSDYATFAAKMPYTQLIDMASGDDWFAPSFATNAENVAASQVAALANDPNLIGWYTDSEPHWGPDWRSTKLLLDDYLALPVGSPGRIVAEQHVGDPNGFVYALAHRYFQVTTAAIRQWDPHHLILGVKAPAQLIQRALLNAARPYVDVFSIDDYQLIPGLGRTIHQAAPQYLLPAADLSNIEAIVQKPLLIGEYGFRAADSGLPNTWPPIFPVYPGQSRRAAMYKSFVATMYRSPWVVGDAWFEYVDEPAGGRTGDGENSNWGLVSVANVPYRTMAIAAKAMHAREP